MADFNAELRYIGLIALQRTWKLPRFSKLAAKAKPYLRNLNDKLLCRAEVAPNESGFAHASSTEAVVLRANQ